MFNLNRFENSRSDGFSVLELLGNSEVGHEKSLRFVPLHRTELTGEVVGPLASLRLRQVFRFSSHEYDKAIEAVYRFPLPGDAAVTGVDVRFGEVEIHAELQERKKAESGYGEAKDKGRQAALLTRESPDVFTLQVAGIQPDQDVVVETRYVQLARAWGVGWSLRIPLTTSPRFVRSDEANSRHADGQPLFLMRDPGHRFSLDLTFTATENVKSPTHKLVQSINQGLCKIQLEQGEVIPDRDCVLNWLPTQSQDRPLLQVSLYDDPTADQIYFLGLLAPPARNVETKVPREVTLLVDHSGSMEGPKWEAADWAVKRFLSDLTEFDHFALGLFHDRTRWLAEELLPADANNVANAVRFLEKNRDSGGTQLGVALEQALSQQPGSSEAARHIVIITDAEVTDSGRILRLAEQEAGQPGRRRIDVLCIDAAPNAFLAQELAERGGGVAKFLTSQPDEDDITTALDAVLADWAQPIVTGLRLEVDRDQIESAERSVILAGRRKAIDLGDLPSGRSLWFSGRTPRGNGELNFRVLTSANKEAAYCKVVLDRQIGDRPGLMVLFGARRVLGLEHLVVSGYTNQDLDSQLARFGYDPAVVLADDGNKKSTVYAENTMNASSSRLNRLLVRESLKYGLASSVTAFLASRTEAGVPVEGTVFVPNTLPSGWAGEFGFQAFDRSAAACMAMAIDDDAVLSALAAAPPQARFSSSLAKRRSSPAGEVASKTSSRILVFDNALSLTVGEVLLFDTSRNADEKLLPEGVRLVGLEVQFPDKSFDAGSLGREVILQIFVDDLAAPRATVRLADLVSQQAIRPLNLLRKMDQRVRIVITVDATERPSSTRLKVWIHWE